VVAPNLSSSRWREELQQRSHTGFPTADVAIRDILAAILRLFTNWRPTTPQSPVCCAFPFRRDEDRNSAVDALGVVTSLPTSSSDDHIRFALSKRGKAATMVRSASANKPFWENIRGVEDDGVDGRAAINAGAVAIICLFLIVSYAIRGIRLRKTKRRMGEVLADYFNDGLALDQLSRRARDVASWRFIGSSECQALVQSAFQRAAETKLAGKAHSLEAEKKLLTMFAAVRSEFGLPERYQNEGWKAGRE
jgi:hypothetical protein